MGKMRHQHCFFRILEHKTSHLLTLDIAWYPPRCSLQLWQFRPDLPYPLLHLTLPTEQGRNCCCCVCPRSITMPAICTLWPTKSMLSTHSFSLILQVTCWRYLALFRPENTFDFVRAMSWQPCHTLSWGSLKLTPQPLAFECSENWFDDLQWIWFLVWQWQLAIGFTLLLDCLKAALASSMIVLHPQQSFSKETSCWSNSSVLSPKSYASVSVSQSEAFGSTLALTQFPLDFGWK